MSEVAPQSGPPMRPLSAWLLLVFLFLAYILSFVDRMILSLLVEPIKADMGLSDTQVSLLQGLAFALFYTLVGLPIGRVVDMSSRVRLVAAGVSVWSLMTALCGLAQSYWQLFLARVGVGVGEATLSPAAYSMIADSFEKKRLGLAMGVYGLGAATGAGLAFMIGGAVIAAVARGGPVTVPFIGELAAWQTAFLIVGLPGLALAAVFMMLPEPPRRGAGAADAVKLSAVLAFIKDRRGFLGFHFLAMGLVNLGIFASASWIAVLLIRNHGVAIETAGYLAGAALMIGGLFGAVGGGFFSDRIAKDGALKARLGFCAATAVVGACFAVAFPLAQGAALTVILFGAAFLFGGVPVGVAAAALQQGVPNRMRGMVSALYLFTINLIGLGLGPTAVALVTDFVFGDEQMVRYSLAIVVPAAFFLAAAAFVASSRYADRGSGAPPSAVGDHGLGD